MHKTTIVGTQQLSDDSLAFKIRCCGDPKTDSVLTIYGVGRLSAEQLMHDVDKHHDRTAAKCQSMSASMKLLGTPEFMKSKTHEVV